MKIQPSSITIIGGAPCVKITVVDCDGKRIGYGEMKADKNEVAYCLTRENIEYGLCGNDRKIIIHETTLPIGEHFLKVELARHGDKSPTITHKHFDYQIIEPIQVVQEREQAQGDKERIICSAIWYQELTTSHYLPTNVDKGVVVCGHRHVHCIHTMVSLTGKRSVDSECGEYIQGFLTDKNRFVDRKEALKIAKEKNQIIHNISLDMGIGLASEDIY